MMERRKHVESDEPTQQMPLRLWPGVVIVMLQWLLRFIIPMFVTDAIFLTIGILGGFLGGLAVFIWWAFFSRAPRFERWGAIVLVIITLIVTSRLTHESIATAQAGLTFFLYAIPVLSLAFVIWAVACNRLTDIPRRVAMVVTVLLACGGWTLVRTEGMTSDIGHDFVWRWAMAPEEQLMAQSDEELKMIPSVSATMDTRAEWPGFRGPGRDGILRGVQIETNWTASPPTELWRRPIGPGFSSFAVSGDLLYTQEQRGEDEVVACYNLTTGEPVWRHHDAVRFVGADANPGPRATPTLSNGRIYTFGATGILNALNASDGTLVWSRNAASDADVKVPVWGFASSPLVVEDIVIVHVVSKLLTYDLATGDQRWVGQVGTGYSSPQLMTINGIPQILFLSGVGITSFAPADGTILWEHPWPTDDRILQPALIPDSDLLISTVLKSVRRIAVSKGSDGWTVEERWTSTRLKSNFFDIVVHEGHAYGFDGPSLACIDLKDGTRKWKSRRYGGQLVLLADQDVLVVLTEKGELALIDAVPDKFTELAKFQAIEGKTWNHPVLVGNILVIRNSQEMVAFRM
ncbi:PQQ-binding-like beta-propeller repeat protein [Bacteroidota bacterium]